ncbi:MAG TPA: 3-oxoacyl-[acyl-carrier-protein] synthase III C-terminal domain-containing protein [Enhygromyxa sp.]|nr:3-oxoacyl-[acyl-carrier-protein] synthase III C-terminal domain-containing protein [Enhygromyxa sp.]
MTNSIAVGIRSLAVAAPDRIRTNDELRERFPELLVRPEDSTLGRIMNNTDSRPDMMRIDASIVPYLDDPFRGVIHRRVLGPDETSIDLEVRAGAEAIALAGLEPGDIDLLISVGFLPHHVGIGNAVYVASRLGLEGGAWNLETACAGPLTALQNAFALIRAGEYQTVLVTISCSYSRFAREDDTLSWFLGDGGGAFVVSRVPEGSGYLASYTMHTADTCGSWYYQLEIDDDGRPARVMRAHRDTGKIMRKSVESHLRRCCEGAASKAGLALRDIDFFVFHTPTAWFANFAADALDIDPERTASVYRHYANIGPALTPINLHYAAYSKRVRPGQTVLVYGPGSVSSAAAVIMRWGEVALGQPPRGIEYDDG